jgi:hypothetical protein
MRRTHQRQLGARRSVCVAVERGSTLEVVTDLVLAHEESIALVRTLLLTVERADVGQVDADHAVAVDAWANHVLQLLGLIAMAGELYCDPVSAPWPAGPGPTAATPFPRFRSRGDCLGRAGQPPRRAAD